MLEELFKLVSGQSQEQIVDNPGIPNDHNEAAIQTTTDSIFDTLKSQVASGNGADVLNLLGGKSNVQGNPLVGDLTTNVTNGLMEKLGIDSPIAKQVAASLVPVVLEKLIGKTNDPGDNSFDLNSIFGSLTGGKSSGFDMNSLLGGEKEKESGSDLGSIFNMLSGK